MDKFNSDASTGDDCVLQLSISGTRQGILEKLKSMVAEIESPSGKPCQGIVGAFNYTSHVITPVWNGREY